jgi:hypothetical protein
MAIRLPPKEGMVTTYRGVVKGNIVVIEGPVDLPDGAEVEVRPWLGTRTKRMKVRWRTRSSDISWRLA